MTCIARAYARLATASLFLLAVASACSPPRPTDDVPNDSTVDATSDGSILDASDRVTPGDGADVGGCRTAADCDDSLFCNGAEICSAGSCRPGTDPCDDHRSCTRDMCDEAIDRCARTGDDTMCADTNLCNGAERCDPTALGASSVTGCTPPRAGEIDCNDLNICTLDSCEPTVGCFHAPRDLDSDGHVDRACTLDGTAGGPPGDDCNDSDARSYPGAMEVCNDMRDNDCDGLVDLADLSGCTPSNDSCATATVLAGAGVYTGSTSGLADDYALGCNTGAFPDAVYEFTTTALQDVVIASTATGTTSAVALTADCAMPQLRCTRATGSTTSPSLTARSLPAGRYRIIVETGAVAASFRLTLTFNPPTPIPGGDVCPVMATDPALDLTDGMPHTAMLSTMDNEYALTCRTATGTSARDAVFRLVVTTASDVALLGTAATGTTYLDFRRSPCGTGASLACGSGSGTTGARLRLRNVAPGTYWVFAENSVTTNPDVTVIATLTPPVGFIPNDRCPEGAGDPVEEISDGLVHTVRLAMLDDNYTIACRTTPSGTSNRDGVLQLVLAEPRDVVIRASAITGTTYVSIRNAPCDGTMNERRCFSGDPSLTRFRALPAGTYYLFIENNSTTNPDVYVTATLTPATLSPPGDLCPASSTDPVIELNDGTGHLLLLSQMEDDYELSCSSTGRRDAVFRLTLAADSDVTIDANALASGTTYVSIRQGTCESDVNQRRCFSTSTALPFTQRGMPAGTYWVMVESSNTLDPEVLVSARITTPPATRVVGDSCATPAVITPDGPAVTVDRSTLLPGADLGTTCGTDPGPGSDYTDATFSFTTTERRDVTINMLRTGTSGSVYWQMSGACSRASILSTSCSTTTSSTTAGTQLFRNLPAGTYYVTAESLNSSTSLTGYVARVTTAPPSGGYVAMTLTGETFTDACALTGATQGLSAIDDAVLAVPNSAVGFPIQFYNTAVTSNLTVSSNGWMMLGVTTLTSISGTVGSTTTPNNVVAGYWRDLDTRTPGVCYAVTGAPGSRRFIVQWNNATHHLSTAENLTFQIVINEAAAGANNTIDLVYGTMTGADTVATSRAGVENSDGTVFTRHPGPYAPISATEPRVVRFSYAP